MVTWATGAVFLLSLLSADAVSRNKFRTCGQTSFCKRNRDPSIFYSQEYVLGAKSIQHDNFQFTGLLQNTKHPQQDPLVLEISVVQDGIVRMKVNEKNPLHKRFQVEDVLMELRPGTVKWSVSDTQAVGTITEGESVVVNFNPFTVLLKVNNKDAILLNGQGKMNFEVYRKERNPKPTPAEGQTEVAHSELYLKYPYDVDGMWDEYFDGHSDSNTRGPASLGMDATFVGSETLFGIPEHASGFALRNTTTGSFETYNEPFRLFNLDVFEYELDEPMALYGAVPYLISHDPSKTVGMLWLNAAETYVDVGSSDLGRTAHWISETGVMEVFLLPGGDAPSALFKQYASLTGFPAMPQRFAIAYHQCRWNYKDEADVRSVDGGFDEHDIPYDVIWLDIEHTDGKKYFTWDRTTFPNSKKMIDDIAAKGRKMVTIVDPHIKRDSGYKVHTQALELDYYIKNTPSKGGVFEGHCWPGPVSYPDFTQKHVRSYWADLFSLASYEGSTQDLFIWNDMNEPSVFNGPEVTMPKDCVHAGDVEHREVHNMYGFYHQMATQDGLIKRDNARPFVLTRSFFAGSQRYGAVWTGDNKASWDHLEASMPMLLSLNVAGITFSGADVGGFFGNPEPDLLARWYQAGAYQPFFRGHAHIETKRREPWLMGVEYTDLIRAAIRQRYAILPYLYTTFYTAATTGLPVMRPLWVEFPKDHYTFSIEEQFMLGSALMIRPVTEKNQNEVPIYLPAGEWYCLHTFQKYSGPKDIDVQTPLSHIPVFYRGGNIVARRERARRSSKAMEQDPFTLVVVLDKAGNAQGHLYLDDGNSFNYLVGGHIHRNFTFSNNKLVSSAALNSPDPTSVPAKSAYHTKVTVERVVIAGLKTHITKATVTDGAASKGREVHVLASKNHIVVRKPDCRIDQDFSIELS